MVKLFKFTKEDLKLLSISVLIVVFIFSGFCIVYAATDDEVPTLTATIVATLTFTVTTDDFGNITAGGSEVFATSTLLINTSNTSGWFVTLEGDEQGTSNTAMDADSDASVGITDQSEWIPGSATTTHVGATSVQISSFANSEDVLAFRVMTASSTNGLCFFAPDWWGTADNYADNANTLWAGIASSTVGRQIGNAGLGSYSASNHLNTVLYYLEAPSGQQGGDYGAPLTYTATTNP